MGRVTDMKLAYHADLAEKAKRLPRGVGRRWTRWLTRRVLTVAGAMNRVKPTEHVNVTDDVEVFIYRPHGDVPTTPQPTLFWVHGGGLVFGDPRTDGAFLRRVVDELGMTVVAVRYRFAVEHPFPVPLDDCVVAYRWTAGQAWVDKDRLVVGGQSAGGGLAAALAQRVHAEGGPDPVFLSLVYPMLDDRSSTGQGPADHMFRIWDREANAYGWDSYLAGHDRAAPPRFAVPARTEDLTGLPPAWIGVGTLDLFFDEDVAYAGRLRAAGVPTELVVVEGAYHGFDATQQDAPVSIRFWDDQIAAIRARLAAGETSPA